MKVLFLDVDGVLNSATWFVSKKPQSVTEVDPAAVRRIQRVVAKTGAKVVLSSSWRTSPELVARLRGAGVPIDDMTPKIKEDLGAVPVRAFEINRWMAEHDMSATAAFAIIDDDPDAGRLYPSRFVRTYWRTGMYGKHERRLIELLGAPA